MYHKVKEEEQIKYFDFTSLYPYIPIGHPEIIIKSFSDISEYFGFVKLKILAPYKLYLPVLPIKAKNGKLLFALCQACANNQSFRRKNNFRNIL